MTGEWAGEGTWLGTPEKTCKCGHSHVFEEASRKWKEDVETEAARLIEKEGLSPKNALLQAEQNIARVRKSLNLTVEQLKNPQQIEEKAKIDPNKPMYNSREISKVDITVQFPHIYPSVLRKISTDHARMYKILPLTFDDRTNTLTLALSDLNDPTILDDLSLTLGCHIHAVLADKKDIIDNIIRYYGEEL